MSTAEWVCVPCARVFRGQAAYLLHCESDVHRLVAGAPCNAMRARMDPSVAHARDAMLAKVRAVSPPTCEEEARRAVAAAAEPEDDEHGWRMLL